MIRRLPDTRGPVAWLLEGASALYGGATALRALAYDRGLLPVHRLPVPVASVGNLTVGGTGKTPTALTLLRLLREAGRRPALLSRGYGGRHARGAGRRGVPLVVGDGYGRPLVPPEVAGDEPVLLARRAGAPVVVCPDRVAAGRLAIERFGADVLVLDDGFQHRRLARDLDLVLVDARRGFGNGRLLPAGPLREPPRALGRAHVVLLTKGGKSGSTVALFATVRRLSPRAALFSAAYRAVRLASLAGDGAEAAASLAVGPGRRPLEGRRVLALSGLADPASFHDLLADLGAREVDALAFPDHHAYGPADYRRLARAAERADCLVTTEKDAVKLDPGRVDRVPALVLEVELEPDDRVGFAAACLARLAGGA